MPRIKSRSVSSDKWRRSLLIAFLVYFSISVHNVLGRRCVCTSKACKEAGVDVCRTRFSCYTEEIYMLDGSSRDNSSTRGCTQGATPLLCETKSWTRSEKRGSTAPAGRITTELELDPSGSRLQMPWPSLKCCDSHDYCNLAIVDHPSVNDRRIDHSRTKNVGSSQAGATSTSTNNSASSGDGDPRSRVLATPRDRKYPIKSPPASVSPGFDRAGSTITNRADAEDRGGSYDPLRHRVRPVHVAVVVLAIAALTSVLGACYVITRFLRNPFEIGSP